MICDLAETYHIYDYTQLPVKLVAVFVFGLPEQARVWKHFGARNMDRELLVLIYDNLNWRVWSHTEDGVNGVNRPERLYTKLYGEKVTRQEVEFEKPEDFKKEWARRVNNANNS